VLTAVHPPSVTPRTVTVARRSSGPMDTTIGWSQGGAPSLERRWTRP
jgi:hypothetical protein